MVWRKHASGACGPSNYGAPGIGPEKIEQVSGDQDHIIGACANDEPLEPVLAKMQIGDNEFFKKVFR